MWSTEGAPGGQRLNRQMGAIISAGQTMARLRARDLGGPPAGACCLSFPWAPDQVAPSCSHPSCPLGGSGSQTGQDHQDSILSGSISSQSGWGGFLLRGQVSLSSVVSRYRGMAYPSNSRRRREAALLIGRALAPPPVPTTGHQQGGQNAVLRGRRAVAAMERRGGGQPIPGSAARQ